LGFVLDFFEKTNKDPNWPFMMPKSQRETGKKATVKKFKGISLRCLLPLLSLLCCVQGGTITLGLGHRKDDFLKI
jgi:hypothetical protein